MGVNLFGGNPVIPSQVQYALYTLSSTPTQFQFANDYASGPFILACYNEIIATADGQVLILPDGIQGSVGIAGNFINKGTHYFQIEAFDGTLLLVVYPATDTIPGHFPAYQLYLTNNATTPGTWHSLIIGGTGSSAQAAQLAGLGLVQLPNGPSGFITLNTNSPVIAQNADFALNPTYRASVINVSGGIQATLENPAEPNGFYFDIINNATNPFTLVCAGNLINNQTTLTLPQGASARIASNGTNYWGYNLAQGAVGSAGILIWPGQTGGTVLLSRQILEDFTTILFTGNLTSNLFVLLDNTIEGQWNIGNFTDGGASFNVAQNDGSGGVGGEQFVLPPNFTNIYINVTQTAPSPLSAPTLVQIQQGETTLPVPIVNGGTGTSTPPTVSGQSLFSETTSIGEWAGHAIRQVVPLSDTTQQNLSNSSGAITSYTVTINLTATNSRVFLVGSFNIGAIAGPVTYFLQQNGTTITQGVGPVPCTGTINNENQTGQGPVQIPIHYLSPNLGAGSYIYTVLVSASTSGANTIFYNRNAGVTALYATVSSLYAIELGGF